MQDLIKEIKKKSPTLQFIRKFFLNKYFITVFLFLIWMIFFDQTSWLVVKELNKDIANYEQELAYYKSEYKKNNKAEREKFARENYFMKKKNEEIFIVVVDSSAIKKPVEK